MFTFAGGETTLEDKVAQLQLPEFPKEDDKRVPPPPSDTPTAGLDLTHLERLVHFYFSKGLAPSTQKTYRAGQNRFLKFCQEKNVSNQPLASLRKPVLFICRSAGQPGLEAQDSKGIPVSTSFHADSGWPLCTGSMASSGLCRPGDKESRGREGSSKSNPANINSPETAGSVVHFVKVLRI